MTKQLGVARRDRFVDFFEVHEHQRFPGDLAEGLRVLDQTAQHPGPALRGFVGQNGAPVVAGGQRLAENLAFFQLEDDLDAPHEGVLNRRDRLRRIGRGVAETKKERILVVADDGDDPNRPHDIRRHIDIGVFVVRFRPVAAARIDIETEDGLVCSPLQPFVDPADLGAVGILQVEDRGVVATEVRLGDLNPAVPLRPGKDGLNVEALPDALFVICRDPLGGRRFDIVDPERPSAPAPRLPSGCCRRGSARPRRRDRRRSSSR